MSKKNFTISTVATAPSPATTGTSLVVASGHGARFAINEPAIVFPTGEQPDSANAEIVTVSNVATDTLTIVREQESTTARTIIAGDIIIQGITAKDWNDLITLVGTKITAFADPNADKIVFWDDSAGAFVALTASTGLTITATDLTVREASAIVTGIVELATDAEFTNGTDETRYTNAKQASSVAQTLTNKTLTSPVLNTGVSGTAVLDEDTMATNSATQLATQQSIKAYVDTRGSNSFQIDASDGDNYGVLSGLVNGSNTTFTTSLGGYVVGSLQVYLNGQLQTQGATEDWLESNEDLGTFVFNTAPSTGDIIIAIYQFTSGATGNADTLDGLHSSSFATLTGTETLTNKTIDGDTNTLVDLQNFKFNLQSNTTNSAPSNLRIEYGWGYIDGAAATNITETVTFPVAFDSAPIVILGNAGDANSAPSAIGDLITSGAAIKSTEDVTTTSFLVRMWLRDAGNLSASVYYGYSWIAIGVKA